SIYSLSLHDALPILSEAESQLSVQAGQIELRATKTEVDDAIDDIELGGKNLILDSLWNERNSSYLFKSFKTSEDLIVGEVYTITVYGELGEDRHSFRLYSDNGYSHLQKPDGTGTGSGGTLSKVKDGIYRATFKYHISPGYEPSSHSSFRIYQFDSKNSSESLIDKIKIEK